MAKNEEEELLSIKQLAEKLNCTPRTVHNMMTDGRIKRWYPAGTYQFKYSEVLEDLQDFQKRKLEEKNNNDS